MAFVDAAIAVGSAVGLEGTAAAIGGGALMAGGAGALAGGLYNGLTGRSVLNGALMGGAIGAVGGATAGYGLGAGSTAAADSIAAGMGYTNAIAALGAGVAPESLGLAAGTTAGTLAGSAAAIPTTADTVVPAAAPTAAAGETAIGAGAQYPAEYMGEYGGPQIGSPEAIASNVYQGGNAATPSMFGGITDFVKAHPYLTAAGVGTALMASQGKKAFQPNYLPTYTPQSAASMGLNRTLSANYQPTRPMATGGIADLTAAGETGLQSQPQQTQSQPVTMDYIKSLANQYGVSLPTKSAASGGSMGKSYNLGSYSDGGRLLKGPGDGMSDNIPATIADKQPARLADGEFVVPADVVSHLGNGSTDAGAKHLYKMMDNVRKARTGRKSQGKQIKADKYLPK